MVRHAVYFDALAKIQDETSPEWRSTLAGLVVLRLVDDWLLYGPHVVTTDVTGLGTIRKTVGDVPEEHPARGTLLSAVDAIEQAELAEIGIVLPQLLAYGNSLIYSRLWKLGIDVFDLALEHTRDVDQYSSAAIESAGQIAFAYRTLGNAEKAANSYTVLKLLAIKAGDHTKRLVAERGFAKLAAARGDLPAAEAMFDEVLRTAEELDLTEARRAALRERSGIAAQRGQYESAIRYAYEELGLTEHSAQRDTVLNNIAAMFLGLGSWQTAQDAFLVIAATAQDPYSRWAATLNLLEIAALHGQFRDFSSYLKELKPVDLPPFLKVEFYIFSGQGYLRFGKSEEARSALQEAIALATEHNFNEVLFRAEKVLSDVDRMEAAPSPSESIPVPISITDVAHALTDLRQLAYADR